MIPVVTNTFQQQSRPSEPVPSSRQ